MEHNSLFIDNIPVIGINVNLYDDHQIHKNVVTSECKTIATSVASQLNHENNMSIHSWSTSNSVELGIKSECLFSDYFEDIGSKTSDGDEVNKNDISGNLNATTNFDLNSVDHGIKPESLYLNHYFDDITGDELYHEYDRTIAQYSSEINGDRKMVHHQSDLLGAGSYGKVYKYGHDFKIAVKWLKIDKLKEFEQLPFNKEYVNIQSINHKNLLKIYGYNNLSETKMIFTEYCESFIELSTFIKNANKEDKIKNAIVILKGILNGLHMLHSRNIMHRDIKADNIIIDQNDLTPKICDYDFIIKLPDDKPYTSGIYGTPNFMAPEVFYGEMGRYTFSADIYSYGCLVIEFLTGQRPWADLSFEQICYKVCMEEEKPLYPDCLNNNLTDFLDKCLNMDPDKRFTAYQLLQHPFLNEFCV